MLLLDMHLVDVQAYLISQMRPVAKHCGLGFPLLAYLRGSSCWSCLCAFSPSLNDVSSHVGYGIQSLAKVDIQDW